MSFLPSSTAPPSRKTVYSPADYVVAPISSGVKADYYTDGVADEVQINAALTAAAALSNGGTVELRNGTYTTAAAIVPPSNTWLRGQNMFATKILTVTNSTYGIIDNYNNFSAGSPWTNGIISDLQLDGTNMLRSNGKKALNASSLQNCKIMRVYAHDTTATGLGADDYTGVTITECIVQNCGYTNPHTITAMVYSSNTFTVTTGTAHGYSIGSSIVITGMTPAGYNGTFRVTTIVDTTNFTISTSNNSGTLQLPNNPGAATTFGQTSDNILGNNGIGVASGSNTAEYLVITNNICIGNQNNNFLIEADNVGTGANASYIFSNNISINGGQAGYRNTGTPDVQFNNNYDYGSLISCFVGVTNQSKTLTVATWSGGVATFTTSTAHGYSVGTYVTVAGVTPSGYNGYYYVASTPLTTTFTVAIASDPGGAGSVFGSSQTVVHAVNNTQINNNTFINPILYGIQVFPHSDGVSARANTIRGAYFYGAYLGAGQGGFTGNTVANCGYDGIEIITGGNYQPLDSLDVSGNVIFNNSTLAASHDGINVTSASTTPIQNLTIRNNKCFDNQNTATQRYGIIVRSGGNNQNVDVSDNTCYGNTTGPILMQDTSNTVSCYNNRGLNPRGIKALGNITGSTAFDTITGDYFTATLTGNVTATFPTSARTVLGTRMTLELTQDGTGSRTVTWPANIKFSYGTGVVSTVAAAVDTISFIWDGTNWCEVGRAFARAQSAAEGGTGLTSFGTGVATWLNTPSSANLAAAVTDETGSGALVFGTSPTITTELDLSGASGVLHFTAASDGADYNIFSSNGAQNLAIYGSAGNTLGLKLLDGNLNIGAPTNNSGDGLTTDATQTVTNKRVTKRVVSTASNATPTPNGDTTDLYEVTSLAAGATFGAPTGTPVDGDKLMIRIKDNGTARSLAWNAIYRFSTDLAAPTTTVISKTLYLGFIYNNADSKWDCLAILNNF